MMEPRPPTGASESSRRSGQSVGSRQSRRSATVSVHSRASEVDVMRVPPRHRPIRDGSFLPQAGSFTVTGLPGYTGYVPGKVAENVYGLTFQNANERSAAEAKILRSTGRLPMSYAGRTYDGPAPGAEIPGYTGFIPGRYADNVMGTTFAKGAEVAFIVKNQQMADRLHRGRERDPSAGRGERPSGMISVTSSQVSLSAQFFAVAPNCQNDRCGNKQCTAMLISGCREVAILAQGAFLLEKFIREYVCSGGWSGGEASGLCPRVWIARQYPDSEYGMAPSAVALGVPWLLLELSAVVIALHGVAAVCTEFVFQTEGFVFGLFYTFAQCLTFAVLALAQCAIRGIPTLHVSALRGSAIAGLAMTVSHGCGILSYIYINYTTAMVFKSAKVPSVLLGARWINKTALTARDLFWALCMMSGLLLFALGDGLESARFTVLGLVFIAVNLAGSTLTANLQQSVLQPSAGVASPCPLPRPSHIEKLQLQSQVAMVVDLRTGIQPLSVAIESHTPELATSGLSCVAGNLALPESPASPLSDQTVAATSEQLGAAVVTVKREVADARVGSAEEEEEEEEEEEPEVKDVVPMPLTELERCDSLHQAELERQKKEAEKEKEAAVELATSRARNAAFRWQVESPQQQVAQNAQNQMPKGNEEPEQPPGVALRAQAWRLFYHRVPEPHTLIVTSAGPAARLMVREGNSSDFTTASMIDLQPSTGLSRHRVRATREDRERVQRRATSVRVKVMNQAKRPISKSSTMPSGQSAKSPIDAHNYAQAAQASGIAVIIKAVKMNQLDFTILLFDGDKHAVIQHDVLRIMRELAVIFQREITSRQQGEREYPELVMDQELSAPIGVEVLGHRQLNELLHYTPHCRSDFEYFMDKRIGPGSRV
ncbi:UTR2 [Symbiodinium sp. CCMP2456]|nr:UTR2 [Symbiodinium sp. CCMP2456]